MIVDVKHTKGENSRPQKEKERLNFKLVFHQSFS